MESVKLGSPQITNINNPWIIQGLNLVKQIVVLTIKLEKKNPYPKVNASKQI